MAKSKTQPPLLLGNGQGVVRSHVTGEIRRSARSDDPVGVRWKEKSCPVPTGKRNKDGQPEAVLTEEEVYVASTPPGYTG